MQEQPISSVVDRDELIEQHRSYVRALAVKIMRTLPRQIDLNELVAYGNIGLIEAAERYDPRRGVSFPTFSHYRIKGAIYDGLREMGVYSRSSHSGGRFTAHATDLLQSAADDEQTMPESSAASLDDEIDSTQSLINALIPVYLLSLESDSVPEMVDANALSTEKIEERELISFVMKLATELTEDEQQLIHSLYFKHLSMTSLAAQMGVTKSWISRLHARAIQHLRDRMIERGIIAESSA